MPLVGTLSTMPLPDLLRWLGASAQSGVLEVERNKVKKRVVFREGRVIAVWTGEPMEFLGHFLVSRGHITEETLRQALARQERSGEHLGTILVSMGVVPDADLARHLAAKAEETLFSLFDLQNAVFRYEEGEASPESLPFPLNIDLRVEDVLRRGLKRHDEMSLIRTVFNDPGIVLRRTPRRPPEALTANRMASRIYGSIDGQRTVAEILLHAHASEYLVTRFLSELLRSGLAEILETRDLAGEATPEPSPRVASPPPRPGPAGGRVAAAPVTAPAGVKTAPPAAAGLQPQLAAAGELVARGEYDAALDLLNTAYRTHPEDRALGRLLAEAEAAFVEKAYRRYLPPSTIPVLKRAPEGLEAERLTPEEFFLLSRIDGTWDVKSIIQISPIREVDALRALKRMHERGFIELREPK